MARDGSELQIKHGITQSLRQDTAVPNQGPGVWEAGKSRRTGANLSRRDNVVSDEFQKLLRALQRNPKTF